MVCWGPNDFGESIAPPFMEISDIGVGGLHSCVITSGKVKCWGFGNQNQLLVPEIKNPRMLALGSGHSCAVGDEGLVCWGRKRSYLNADDVMAFVGGVAAPPKLETVSLYDYFKRPRPVVIEEKGPLDYADDLPVLRAVTQSGVVISTGSTHSCYLKTGVIECFGDRDAGQTTVPALTNPRQVSTGFDFSCAIADEGVVCWGDNSRNQANAPFTINPIQIATGGRHACLLDGATVDCWGWNFNGQTDVPSRPYVTHGR